LVRLGWALSEIGVDATGRVTPDALQASLSKLSPSESALVSVMAANNETGVEQDLEMLAEQVGSQVPHSWFHSDAVQLFGKRPLNFRVLNSIGVHAMTISAHKIGGPQGAGALVVDKRIELAPLIAGGGQERGLRSGTENVAAIVGFGLAAELAVATMDVGAIQLLVMREALEQGLRAQGATLFGGGATRLPNTSYFAFPGLDGETLVGRLDRAGFAVAAGAACSSAKRDVSPVLLAMGVEPSLARGAIRVSLGNGNTMREIKDFLAALATIKSEFESMTAVAA